MEARHNMTNIRVVFAAFALVALASPKSAAAGQEVIAGGVVAATSIESRTEMSAAAAVGFRVNRLASIGVEVTSVPTLKPDVAALDPSTLLVSNGAASGTDGRATIFTTNVRIEIPMSNTRIIPYVIAGGGVANVKESFTITAPVPVPPGIPVVIPPRPVTQSSTALALTTGGGVSMLVATHVSIDVDLRYARLIANRDLNVGRFGVGLSYRF